MKQIFKLVLSLTIISAVCAGVLSFININTMAPIEKIQRAKTEDAAKEVMPAGVERVERENDLFIGKNKDGEIIGYAIEGCDPGGYGGDIVLMVGFEADKKTVVCYRVLRANETPGLGSKLSDAAFAEQFRGKKGGHLRVKKDGGEIEALTSATITSRAVCLAIGNARKKIKHL